MVEFPCGAWLVISVGGGGSCKSFLWLFIVLYGLAIATVVGERLRRMGIAIAEALSLLE